MGTINYLPPSRRKKAKTCRKQIHNTAALPLISDKSNKQSRTQPFVRTVISPHKREPAKTTMGNRASKKTIARKSIIIARRRQPAGSPKLSCAEFLRKWNKFAFHIQEWMVGSNAMWCVRPEAPRFMTVNFRSRMAIFFSWLNQAAKERTVITVCRGNLISH